jgi:predicted P-loop ATPase
VLNPGKKFDHILVLNGPQGIGKSTLIAKLGGDWYSDSLSLSDMNDKTAAEKLQGFWLLEIGELAGMRKADIDKVKAFITRQDDKYRASFGRRVTPHPRQCVFFGTTNTENGYLRDVSGNRRFFTVKTPGTGTHHTWELTNDDIQQIWAEAKARLECGETLYLEPHLESQSRREQRQAMEQDEREGLVRVYLDMPLPERWDTMSIYERQAFIRDPEELTSPRGVNQRKTVSNIEIWCECFGKPKEDLKPSDSYAIAAIMERIEGWTKNGRYDRLSLYGKQRLYEREQPAE